ncbi:MAG: hypothetical protein KAH34_08670 [Ketobacter sp.]|nr:hypothetical protein [Ketobacter sp.]
MTNVYQAPASELLGEHTERPKKRWKCFFWLMLTLEALSLLGMLAGEEVQYGDLALESVIYGIVLSGLYGFAYQKRLLVPVVWKLALPMVMGYDAYSIATTDTLQPDQAASLVMVVVLLLVVLLPLLLFQYYALFRYGFKCNFIWGSQ